MPGVTHRVAFFSAVRHVADEQPDDEREREARTVPNGAGRPAGDREALPGLQLDFDSGRPARARGRSAKTRRRVPAATIMADPAESWRHMHPDDRPAFVAAMRARFPKDARVVLGCKSGGRSARAAALLEAEGYTAVLEQRAGWDGERGPFGEVVTPGWKRAGLPIEEG